MTKFKVLVRTYLKFFLLVLLMASAFAYAMFQGGFVSWFLFYSFLPFGLFSLSLFLYPITDFLIERAINRSECRAGDSLEVTLTIKRRFAFPLLYLVIEECLPEKLEKSGVQMKKELIFPWFKREFVVSYHIESLVRGEHEFNEVIIKVGDLLGLIEKEESFSVRERVLVYPSYYELPYKQIGTQYNQGQTASTVRIQREVSTLSGLREYQPGDRFSWINWKATARKNEIMTKEFEEKKSQDVFMLLDTASSSSFEPLISLAASIALAIVKKGIPIGFFMPILMDHPLSIQGGDGQRQKIFHLLARAEQQNDVSVMDILDKENQVIPFNIALMIVTSHLTEETVGALAQRKQSRAISIIVLNSKRGLSNKDIQVQQLAAMRGIQVRYLGDQAYTDGTQEVSGR
ncbi:uncharacterized protein (DUF58 family) [Peribacillus deserti]|uniref:Uncharacterized protein (DUF58 family) n=1 Tax=Peribacillus deserti TaxID=673318 RepID=A0ABS2QNG9_9BACI|nr:DUF58 domain-containing protein [Peribacillus deserti]MBM7694495.1 uncharacterized protein (DUF58 family) [Peribacillus deserti]